MYPNKCKLNIIRLSKATITIVVEYVQISKHDKSKIIFKYQLLNKLLVNAYQLKLMEF